MKALILVIEDDSNIRENVIQLLEFEGYEATGAFDGREGLRLLQTLVPDLILCDVSMPHTDGFQVLEVVSASPTLSLIPFVFLTARAARQDVRYAMTRGAVDYLTKPFSDNELLETVAAHLKRTLATAHNENSPLGVSKTSVLLLQSNQYILRIIQNVVMKIAQDADLKIVSSVAELDAELETGVFRLCVMDEDWFETHGVQSTAYLKVIRDKLKLAVVVVTNTDSETKLSQLRACGITQVVARPINIESLQENIQRAYDTSKALDDSSVTLDTRSLFAVITDVADFEPISKLLHGRYNIEYFSDWSSASSAARIRTPGTLFYDVPTTVEAVVVLQQMSKEGRPVIRLANPTEVVRDFAHGETILHRPFTDHSVLRTLIRDVLRYTGSFEYNAVEYLKTDLLLHFSTSLKKVLESYGIVSHSSSGGSNQTLSSELLASNMQSTILSFRVPAGEFWVTFEFQATTECMRKVASCDPLNCNMELSMPQIIKYWNTKSEGISHSLNSAFQCYGIETDSELVTTRVHIDRLAERFHWFIESGFELKGNYLMKTKFGVSVARFGIE